MSDRGVFGDGDELCPASFADGRVRVEQEAEDVVAHLVVPHVVSDLLDDTGVVTAEDDREVVVDAHLLEHSGGDPVVDWVDGGRVDAHEDLVGRGCGCRQVH